MESERSSVHDVMECDLVSRFPNQYSQEHVDLYHTKEKSNLVSKLTMFGIASAIALSTYFSGVNYYLATQMNNLSRYDSQTSNSPSENPNSEHLTPVEDSPNQELKDEGYGYLVAASIFGLSYFTLNFAKKTLSKK